MENREDKGRITVTDKRFWVQDESIMERAEIPEKRYPSYVEELKARTELAEKKLREKVEKLDQENEAFRRRLSEQMEVRLERLRLEMASDFLEILDNLERALESITPETDIAQLQEGLRLNIELFLQKLKALGLEPVAPLNQPFDPHEAEAVGVVPVDDPALDHVVVEVIQPGYRCGDHLLRPARVRVAQYDPAKRPVESAPR